VRTCRALSVEHRALDVHDGLDQARVKAADEHCCNEHGTCQAAAEHGINFAKFGNTISNGACFAAFHNKVVKHALQPCWAAPMTVRMSLRVDLRPPICQNAVPEKDMPVVEIHQYTTKIVCRLSAKGTLHTAGLSQVSTTLSHQVACRHAGSYGRTEEQRHDEDEHRAEGVILCAEHTSLGWNRAWGKCSQIGCSL